MKLFVFLFIIHLLGTFDLVSPTRQDRNTDQNTCEHPDCFSFAASLGAGIDWSTNPCDDFFQFTCGRWIRKTDNPKFDTRFTDHSVQGNLLKSRIKEILRSPLYDDVLLKAQSMYYSCVNTDREISNNTQELRRLIDVLGGWKLGTRETVGKEDVINLITKVASSREISVPFILRAGVSNTNRSYRYPTISQPINDKLLTHLYPNLSAEDITKLAYTIFSVYDKTQAEQDAQNVLQFDGILKELMNNQDNGRNLYVNDKEANEQIEWLTFLNAIFKGVKTFLPYDVMRLEAPIYFQNFFSLINDPKNARTAYNYIILYETIKYVHLIGSYLPSPLREVKSFSTRIFSSRWDFCLEPVIKCYDLAIARKYGELYRDIKKEIEMLKEMTDDILKVFEVRLGELDWLDEPSRNNAYKKLHCLKRYYEYPSWIMDLNKVTEYYADVENTGTFMGDNDQCTRHLRHLDLERLIETPRGHVKWYYSPLTVNAYYASYKNDMHILEAMLEEPFFNIHRLRAMNYAEIGSALGHEIVHGFDNKGVLYDEIGRYKFWLTNESQKKFDERTKCLVDQYSNFKLTRKDLPGPTTEFQVDGELTLGENIADDGGLKMTYFAYQQWLKDHNPEMLPDILKKNFTDDQTFFLSYARQYCVKYEYGLSENYLVNEHSPDKFRVNGPLSNFDKFAEAFNCPVGSPMVRGEKACHVW